MTSQKGFAHILLLLLLIAGLGIGVYLVQNQQVLRSRASEIILESKSIDQLTEELEESQQSIQGRSAQANQIGHLRIVAEVRKEKLLAEMESDPQGFIEDARLINKRDQFPDEIKDSIEQRASITGSMILVHGDNFETKESDNGYFVQQEEKFYELFFIKAPRLETGALVEATGVQLGSRMALAGDESTGSDYSVKNVRSATALDPKGDQRFAVLLVNFNSDRRQPFNTEEVRSLLFSDQPTSVGSYYKENSFHQTSVSGDVFDWISIEGGTDSCSWYSGNGEDGNSRWSWTVRADQAAKQKGIPIESYQRVIYIFPEIASCKGWAYGTLGGANDLSYIFADRNYTSWVPSRAWMLGGVSSRKIPQLTHEIGHNLGVHHANSLSCRGKSVDVYSNCEHTNPVLTSKTWPFEVQQGWEYGDPYDVMGNAGMLHFNAPHKVALGWINQDYIREVGTSGTYTLTIPIEAQSSSAPNGIQVLKVAKPDTTESYYISFHQERYPGWINPRVLTGASIHIWNNYIHSQTKLITSVPNGGDFIGSSLFDGASFYDFNNGITITQISHTPSSVTLSVKFGPVVIEGQSSPSPSSAPSSSPTASPRPRASIPPIGSVKWTIRASAVCSNGKAAVGISRINLAHWPLEKYDLNNPLTWYQDEFEFGQHIVYVSEEPKSVSVYYGLETAAGEWLQPITPLPTGGFVSGKFFNPGKWMVKMNKGSTITGDYDLKYQAPAAWCQN